MTYARPDASLRQRSSLRLLGLLLLALLSALISLAIGNIDISLSELWQALAGHASPLHEQILWQLRLPRTLHAFTTGALLAVAGSLMQVLLRNPLADPYILGVSGGAAVFALLAMLLGLAAWMVPFAAFIGALLAMLLVFALARGEGSWTPTRLLLTGVVLASGWGAIISFILSLAPDNRLRSLVFWLMGDLGFAQNIWPALFTLLAGLLLGLYFARRLNVLSLGAAQAQTLGVNVTRLRWQIYVLASMLTAMAIVQAGSIGFVGLIIPHLLRLMGLRDYRLLLPAAVLAGGSLLMLADTLARTAIENSALPVGALTAAIGVPIFIFLLYRGARHL